MEQRKKLLQLLQDEKARENFWYYHKGHVIVAVFCMVLLTTLIVDTVKNSQPVLQLMTVNIPTSAETQLNEACAEALDESRSLQTDSLVLSDTAGLDQETVIYRIDTRFTAGEVDVFAAEESIFQKYAGQGYFSDLTPYLPEGFVDTHSELLCYVEADGETVLAGLLWLAPDSTAQYVLALPFSTQLPEAAAAVILAVIEKGAAQ